MEGTCRAGERAPGRYQPRRPSQSALYRYVQEHLATWLAHSREGDDDDGPVPPMSSGSSAVTSSAAGRPGGVGALSTVRP
jgi:hypothetical protein